MNREQAQAAVVTWWGTAHQVPAGGKVEAFRQGKRSGAAHHWEVFVSDAADVIVDRARVWTYTRRGETVIYSEDNVVLARMTAPPKAGAGIRLSQVAPWNSAIKNPYRTRYTQAGGRYFQVRAEDLNSVWWVEEVHHDGRLMGYVGDGIALNLDQARTMIAAAVAK